MRHHTLRALLALLLPVLLLTGCWQEELPPENPGDLFPLQEEEQEEAEEPLLPASFSLPYVPDQTLDPLLCPDGMQQVIGSLLYEGLFHLDQNFQPQKLLCASYSYDPDKFTYVFTLRDDVRFSDGSPLTGADVKATLNRARKTQRYQARLSQISRISASGNTVTVTLSVPNINFPALLDIPILKAGSERQGTPLGTGPYLLSYDNNLLCLVASQTWWQGTQPVERISLVEASDWDTMFYRFSSHEVQLITADLIGETPISTTGSIAFQDTDTTVLQYLGFNTTRKPLDDAAFRSVLWSGFSRSTVVSAFLSGHGRAAQFPVSPASSLYPTELEVHYSREGFTTALQNIGHQASRTLTLLVNSENPFKVSVADYIAKSFTGAGVPVTVKALPWADYCAALSAGNFDLYYGEVRMTADWNPGPLLGTGGSLNFGGWSSPATDQLIQAYRTSPDPAGAMEALCKHLRSQAPIIPICFSATSVLTQSNVVEGLVSTAAEPFHNLKDCTIHLQ